MLRHLPRNLAVLAWGGIALLTGAAASPASADPIPFKDRRIDVDAHLKGFPYDPWRWEGSLRHQRLYFLENIDGKTLVGSVSFAKANRAPASLTEGTALSRHDFTGSGTFNWDFRAADGSIFLTADENNNEAFNIHWVKPGSDKAVKLTDVHYIAGYGFSPDESQLAYLERQGPEGSRFRLHVLDLATRQDRVVAVDDAAQQMTWSTPSWSPDGRGILVTTMTGSARDMGNIAYVALSGDATQKPEVLTDASVPRTFPKPLKDWLSDEEGLFLSNEGGTANVYAINVKTKAQRAVTRFDLDVAAFKPATIDGSRKFVALVTSPLRSYLYVVDPAEGGAAPQLILSDATNMELLDVQGDQALIKKTSAVSLFEAQVLTLKPGAKAKTVVTLPRATEDKLVHCDVEAVKFKTFDDISFSIGAQKYQGELHGMLYKPKKPLPASEGLVVIESFYGGGNDFTIDHHVLCEAGIYLFSPAPRGGSLVNAAFERLNDGDLGGNEIIDVIYAAKYVSQRLGIPPERIGAWGHSHGGYATLRLLTFPGEVNGHQASFPFGFGISQAGFGSIMGEYKGGNIQNWIVKEAGDPQQPGVLARWEDRSPINNAEKLSGKLLLIHGTADRRVPFSESQAMHDRLHEIGLGDRVRLVPLKDVGHPFNTDAANRTKYEAWFSFLETIGNDGN